MLISFAATTRKERDKERAGYFNLNSRKMDSTEAHGARLTRGINFTV